jgi:hypothetical protein
VLDLIGAARHRLTQQPDDQAPEKIRQSFSRSLRDLMLNLRAAHAAMPWLAATQTPSINLGSLYLAEECAEVLVGKAVDLVMVPDVEFMYSTESWPFAEVVDDTDGFVPKTDRRPVVLHYPLSDSDRLLLHPIFAHELGHSAADEGKLVNRIVDELDADPAFLEELEETVELMRVVWPANPASQTVRTLRASLRAWIEELLCDHMALEVFGPAYLWAFANFVLPQSYAEPHPAYPPNTVRTKLAMELLEERGWLSYMESTAPEITKWLTEIGRDAEAELEPRYSLLRNQLTRRADLLRSVAHQQAGSSRLTPASTVGEAAEAADLLEQLILPVGSESPLAPRSILLGGWQRALAVHGDSPEGLITALDDDQLQGLVGKGVEMSVVVSAWEEK